MSALDKIIEELGVRAERTTVFLENSDVLGLQEPNTIKTVSLVSVTGTYDPPTKTVVLAAVCKDIPISQMFELEMPPENSQKLLKPSKEKNDKLKEEMDPKLPRRSKRLNTPRDNPDPKKQNHNLDPQEPRDPEVPQDSQVPRDPDDSKDPEDKKDKKDSKKDKKDKKKKKKGSKKEDEVAKTINEQTESRQEVPKEIESPEIKQAKEKKSHMELRERKEKKQQEGNEEKKKQKEIKSPEKLSKQRETNELKECREQKVQKDKMELRERKEIKSPKGTKVIEAVLVVALKQMDFKKLDQKEKKKRRMSLEVRERKEFNRKQRRVSLERLEPKESNKRQRRMSIEVRESKEFNRNLRRMSFNVKERKKILDKPTEVKETRELRDRKELNKQHKVSTQVEPQEKKIKKNKA